MLTGPFDAEVLGLLAPFGEIDAVRDLAGGRGRTFRVDHVASSPASEPNRTVVHLRTAGPEALAREAAATRRAHALGIGPEVLAVDLDRGALVTRWVPGTSVGAHGVGVGGTAVIAALGAVIARLHAGDAGSVDPPGSVLTELDPLATRRRYLATARVRGVRWPPDVLTEQRRVDLLAERVGASPAPLVLCHGDLVPANFVLVDSPAPGTGPVVLLDHEYAGLAEAAFDVGGLAATAELDDRALAELAAASGVAADRARDWRDITRHAWFVWVALDEDLGPEAARWRAWAERARLAWAGGATG